MDVLVVALLGLNFILGYLCGSVPSGLILTKLAGVGDVRKIGSGNIGATNVLRTGNKGLAALTLVFDALKGAIPVWLIGRGYFEPSAAIALGAFLGHLFPVWLGFKGGKGIATYAGLLLAFSLGTFVIFAVVWLCVAVLLRYSSLAALCATLVSPISLYFSGQADVAILFAVLTALACFMHRANISRLLSGSESKIGAKG